MKSSMKKLRKIPIRIYLEPNQETIIRRVSEAKGISKAAIIRSCISKFITGISLENDPALNLMNLGDSGKNDISQYHDDYLISFEK